MGFERVPGGPPTGPAGGDLAGTYPNPTVVGGAGLPVVDTTAIVKGSVDPTKLVRIEADGLTTGTTRAITMPDANLTLMGGFTQGSVVFAGSAGNPAQDNANLFWNNALNRLGIGTPTPLAPFELVGDGPGSVGGFPSGTLHVRSPSALVNANAVITGHNSFGGNKQLWYVGSTSSSNDDITFLNRQNAALSLGTNSATRLTISAGGNIGIGGIPDASALLDLISTTKAFLPPRMTTAQIDAIPSPATGLVAFDTDEDLLRVRKASEWCHIPCGLNGFSTFEPKADPATSPSAITIGVLRGFELPDAGTKAVVWGLHLPNDINLTVNPSISIHFAPTVAGAGNANVRFQLEARYVAIGEQIDKAVDETVLQTKAVIDVVEEMHNLVIVLNASLITAGDFLVFVLSRIGLDAADTYTGNIGILEDQGALLYTRA